MSVGLTEADLSQKAEQYEPDDPRRAVAANLAELLKPHLEEGASLRETFKDDRDGANLLGGEIINWYQKNTRDAQGTDNRLVAAAQVAVQPVVIDLVPTVGSEMQTTLTLLYPGIGSIACRNGLVDAGPTIEFIQDSAVPRLTKERIFEEWSWYATVPEVAEAETGESADQTDPETQFRQQAKRWLTDFIGSWDGQSIHIDPRLLAQVAEHIEDPELKYRFVLTHVIHQPEPGTYPPEFKLRKSHDASLLSWLEQQFRNRNLGVNLVTGQAIRTPTEQQLAFEARMDELFDAYAEFQRQRER